MAFVLGASGARAQQPAPATPPAPTTPATPQPYFVGNPVGLPMGLRAAEVGCRGRDGRVMAVAARGEPSALLVRQTLA
jgi:hypothetical protein